MGSNLTRVETLLPKKDVERMDEFVDEGLYATRTDFIRAAVKRLLYSRRRLAYMEKAFALVQRRLKQSGVEPEALLREFESRKTGRKAEEMISYAKTSAYPR